MCTREQIDLRVQRTDLVDSTSVRTDLFNRDQTTYFFSDYICGIGFCISDSLCIKLDIACFVLFEVLSHFSCDLIDLAVSFELFFDRYSSF